MAAPAGVDLLTVSHLTHVPYGTLARWACEKSWVPVGARGRRKLYSWQTIADELAARDRRQAA